MATGQVLFQRFFYTKSFVKHSMEVRLPVFPPHTNVLTGNQGLWCCGSLRGRSTGLGNCSACCIWGGVCWEAPCAVEGSLPSGLFLGVYLLCS